MKSFKLVQDVAKWIQHGQKVLHQGRISNIVRAGVSLCKFEGEWLHPCAILLILMFCEEERKEALLRK